MSFYSELKRRNVFRVSIAYLLISWVLLQGADFGLDLIDAPNWVIQVLFLLAAIGLPAVLIFAWVFEMTPEGIKRESEIDRSQSLTSVTGRKLDRVIIAILTLALAVLVLERFYSPGKDQDAQVVSEGTEATDVAESNASVFKPAPEKSIAVLPLVNRSVRAEDAFFAEGIHDELLTQLSRISALKVISRTSVMGYAGTTKRMTEIGDELGVATLLEGGVQRAGDRVRINVQLIEAATDEHLWAEVYDRELTTDNLFDIQTDITTAIASALQAVLTGEERQSLEEKLTDNVEAYGHYLRARANAAVYGRDVAAIDTTIASYQRAIELDPKFAAAYSAMSIDYSERHWINPETNDDAEKARAALEQAQRLAPNSVETLSAAGYYHYWGNRDYDTALNAFDQALLRKPGSALALRGRAYVLRRMGRLDEALESFRKAISLDPLHAQMRVDMAYTLTSSGEIMEALASVSKANAVGTPSYFGLGVQADILTLIGRFEECREVLGPLHPEMSAYMLNSYYFLVRTSRNPEWTKQLLAFLEENHPDINTPFQDRLITANLLWRQGSSDALDISLNGLGDKLAELERNAEHPEQVEDLLVSRMTYHALLGEREALQEAMEQYRQTVRPDAMKPVEQGEDITLAYAMVGDFQTALDRIEQVTNEFGPWEFARYGPDALFDPIREDPRFLALQDRYRRWLESIQ
jgi:TolB-like protein